MILIFGLGGLGITCLPRDPRFAGSNPAEVDGLFQYKSSGRDSRLGVPSQRFKAGYRTSSLKKIGL